MSPSDISTSCPPLSPSSVAAARRAAPSHASPLTSNVSPLTPHAPARRILFVRSGGGMPGLDIHAGIWLALEQAGIRASHCAGTSAGAIISAMDAAGMSAERAVAILAALQDREVRREAPFWKVRVPWLDAFLHSDPIAGVLRNLLPATWDEMRKPLAIYATRLDTMETADVAAWAHPGGPLAPDPATAALVSMSISGVFPAVTLADGREWVDGSPRRNLPLPEGWHDYDEVWLLIASQRPRDFLRRRGILTRLIRNLEMAWWDQVADVLDEVRPNLPGNPFNPSPHPIVRIIWPHVPAPRGMLRFNHAAIWLAYAQAQRALGLTPPLEPAAAPEAKPPSASPGRPAVLASPPAGGPPSIAGPHVVRLPPAGSGPVLVAEASASGRVLVAEASASDPSQPSEPEGSATGLGTGRNLKVPLPPPGEGGTPA